jgi:hypothetical protein
MLRTERPRLPTPPVIPDRAQVNSREMLLAVAPPPTTRAPALEGWPSWLIPAYRSGGHRPEVRLLEEER